MYFDERNNFTGNDFLAIPLVFKIIDIIELIDSHHLANGLKY